MAPPFREDDGVEYYFLRYGDIELHRRMVSDRRRTQAFAEALFEVISADSVVLDIGTGTGILAMVAARAGAKKVFAVDYADIVDIARQLVRTNGVEDVVAVQRSAAEDVVLSEKVDVLVSEWLGSMALVESMFGDVIAARDANLAPDGIMIPSRVSVRLAPIDDPITYMEEGPGFWRDMIQTLDLSELERLELRQGRTWQRHVDPGALLAEGKPIVELDMKHASVADTTRRGRLEFPIRRDGVLNGFCGWFAADLTDRVSLDTAPGKGPTHWAQTYLPFEPRIVRKGEIVSVDFALDTDPVERRFLRLELSVGEVRQVFVVE